MFSRISELYSNLQNLPIEQITEQIKSAKNTLLDWAQGTIGRSAVREDPKIIAEHRPTWLQIRFDQKPGYILFENTPYHVYFVDNKPVVTLLQFKKDYVGEKLAKIKALFPFEPEPLKNQIDSELEELNKALDTDVQPSISFNSTLIRKAFSQPSPTHVPFIEFSDIVLVKHYPNEPKEELVQRVLAENDSYNDLPILMEISGFYWLYGNTNGDRFGYTQINNKLITDLKLSFRYTPNLLSYHLNYYPLYEQIVRQQAHTYFSKQAQQIKQIQKIINGLHYCNLIVDDAKKLVDSLKNLNITTFISTFVDALISRAIFDNIDQALIAFSEFDINFLSRFQEEISALFEILEQFHRYSQLTPHPETNPSNDTVSRAFQIGHAMGFTILHMHAPNGTHDFHALSQLSANLPKHLAYLTALINDNTSTITQHAPNLNEAQLKALQTEATKLLNAIKNTQVYANYGVNPVYWVYQIINYLTILNQMAKLLSTNLQQIGYLNDASQELIITYLKIIKYVSIKTVGVTDKIQIEFMLAPSPQSLSNFLKDKLQTQYDALVQSIKNVVQLENRDPACLLLEDQAFYNQRMANID
ncbi:MAG TPA: hypothetical protein VHD33_02920, partial [Legionellaceae bacterium]|nr:hypothetical protein [Legionellaceae bacterium]